MRLKLKYYTNIIRLVLNHTPTPIRSYSSNNQQARIEAMLPSINQVLPTEMLKKILENLDYKSIHSARQTCKRWKEIIYKIKLVEKYSNKLSMKALAGWKHFLIDSTFRIGTVLEWVFQLVILLNSCFQSDNM